MYSLPVFSTSKCASHSADACPTGSYSDSGFEPCKKCPKHFFQSSRGKTTCFECSDTSYTEQEGTTTEVECKDGGNAFKLHTVCC